MFRMTKMTDYGIVLLTHFAAHDDQVAHTARELALETRLPLPTVGKLLKQLSRGGLLASQRGTKGGYILARPPREITISAIIATLEGPVAITECNTGESHNRCEHESFCSVRPNWQIINDTIRGALEGLTLAEMTRPLVRRPHQPSAFTSSSASTLPVRAPEGRSAP
jgi:FeS assembly SUF system regulator